MTLTPDAVFDAWPQLRSDKLRDIQNWVKNVLGAAELWYHNEQVEPYELDTAMKGIAIVFPQPQADQLRKRAEWLPVLESTLRQHGWHFANVDLAKGALILAVHKRVAYLHLAGAEENDVGIALGLGGDETLEELVKRVRRDGVWVDTGHGRSWHSPDEIVEISFPVEALVPLE